MPSRKRKTKNGRIPGQDGGLTISQNRAHMAAIGRRGAAKTNRIRAEKRMVRQIADVPLFSHIVQ